MNVIKEQKKHFKSVEFTNLSISALGVFDKESSTFLKMLNDLDVKYCIKKIINICIRSSYYILYLLLSQQGMDKSRFIEILNI